MNISPIAYNNSFSMKSSRSTGNKQNKINIAEYPPAAVGAINGACWFGIGYAFDKMCKLLFKSNMSNKTSLVVNAAIGLAMGSYTYIKAKQLQKNA